jgi:L-glutamine-phosphate cytidylyltransferase
MKAIILAAGTGSRLMPLTSDKPKCMVKFVGKTLLSRQISILRRSGVDEIIVVGGHHSEKLKGDFDYLKINSAYEITNMVTTLFCAREHLTGAEDVLISYGDIIFEPKVLNNVRDVDGPIVTAIDLDWRKYWELRQENPLDDAESLLLSNTDYISQIGRKPKSYNDIEGQFIGLTKIRSDFVLKLINIWQEMDKLAIYDGQSFEKMYMTSFLQHLIEIGQPVRAAFVHNGWLEVDTVDDLMLYEELNSTNQLKQFIDLEG